MALSDSLREELKTPLGELVPESRVSREAVQKIIPVGSYVVSVGDKTTEKMIGFGMVPSLQIIDNREKRKKRKAFDIGAVSASLECKNPAAEITPQSIDTIREAFSLEPPVRITVDGEEDLLVVPACIYAPDGSVVLYGQPGEGLVVVPVTAEIRNKTKGILDKVNGYDETVAV